MRYRHADDDLRRLDEDPLYNAGLPRNLVRAYRVRMNAIRVAVNENDLRAIKSYHFEKLKGDRKGQYSIRLNRQFRLIFAIEEEPHGHTHTIVILGIEDYHRG
jgi:proteic killer suppression protein